MIVNGNVCFHKGKKRRGKRGHHEGRTRKACNPSRIAPTYLQFHIGHVVEDYELKEWVTVRVKQEAVMARHPALNKMTNRPSTTCEGARSTSLGTHC